jgi:hypothetical protein
MMGCSNNKSSQCKKIIFKKELFSQEVLKKTLDVQEPQWIIGSLQ